jgi:hypothetical protein
MAPSRTALSALGESQKPKSAGSHARSGRRLELRPRHKAFLIPFLESRHGRPVHKIRRKDRLCGGFITRHCYVHDGQWRSDISIQHFRFTDHSWSYVSNGPICSKSNTIHGLPFRNSRLGLGRCNGRTSCRQKQGRSFGKTAKRNSLRIRPRTVRSKPAARRYGKGGEDIAGSPFTLPPLIRPPTISSLGNLLISPPSQRFCEPVEYACSRDGWWPKPVAGEYDPRPVQPAAPPPTQFVRGSANHPDEEYDIFTGLIASLASGHELKQAGRSYRVGFVQSELGLQVR